MRIGVDLGGTKTEALALDDTGRELRRIRVSTPQQDYPGTVRTIASLVQDLERELGKQGTVGVGIPGTIVAATGLVKNANSTWLNGQPLQRDLSSALSREVRCANDANCFAISEATDGAAVGAEVVFGVIMGTGCGGGGPTYFADGRMMRLSATCSSRFAHQPITRLDANVGVNSSRGSPQWSITTPA